MKQIVSSRACSTFYGMGTNVLILWIRSAVAYFVLVFITVVFYVYTAGSSPG